MAKIRVISVSLVMIVVLLLVSVFTVYGQEGVLVIEDFEGIDSAEKLDEDVDAGWFWGANPTVRTFVASAEGNLGQALEIEITYPTPGTLFAGRDFAPVDVSKYEKFAFWLKIDCEDPAWFRDMRVRLHGLPGGSGGNLQFSITADSVNFGQWQYIEVSLSELGGSLAAEAEGKVQSIRLLPRMQGSAPSPATLKVTIDDIKFIPASN